jgi:hypothetical protein
MAKKIGGVSGFFLTGFPGYGVPEVAEAFARALRTRKNAGRHIETVNIGDVVTWMSNQKSRAGNKVRAVLSAGEVLGDDLTSEALNSWVTEETKRNPALHTLLITLAPSSVEQMQMLDLFESPLLVHVQVERDPLKEEQEIDSKGLSADHFDGLWKKYNEKTVPAVRRREGTFHLGATGEIGRSVGEIVVHLSKRNHFTPYSFIREAAKSLKDYIHPATYAEMMPA